ncbi:MAG: LysR family transcriptional regulator [Gammaproteobacteria bacterium]|nr:LysR family transcriptional regulator [Gammaproteobacteria bacterium]
MDNSVYYKQNRLKKLRAFCFTARLGSFSQAAEALYLSQPSVTLQVQALERDMDMKLFERRGPSIRLTPEGEALYLLANPLVDGIDRLAESFAASFGSMDSGEINIAAGESTILYILPDAITRFAERYPGIKIKLHNVTGRDGMAMLRADEADLAVGSMLEVPDDIDYRPSLSFDPYLITPLDHPLAGREKVRLKEISPYGLILPPRHLSTWRMVDLVFTQNRASYQVALEAGGWEVVKKYVALGLGVSIVTDVCLKEGEPLSRIPLGKYFPRRSYGVVVRKGKFLSPPAKKFIELMDPDFL